MTSDQGKILFLQECSRMQNAPLVSIVIVTWNGEKLLQEFMPSVMALDYPNYEVIALDNASTDGSVDFLRRTYPTVKIVQNSRNDGTAEGSNVGAKAATGKYIFFISNDMWLDSAILSHTIPHMEQDEKIGICTVKMRRIMADGTRLMELDSVGADVDIFGCPASRGILQQDEGQFDEFTDVFFSFGGAMIIRRNLFEQTGGYDPEFFTLTDDIDLSWRVRLLGYTVVVEPKAFLYHRVSATLDTPAFKRALRRFLSERNTIRTILKNYSALSLLWVFPLDMILLSAEILFFLIQGQWQLAGAGVKSIGWNLARLGGTMKLRRQVQKTRAVGDREIMKHMMDGSCKLRAVTDFFLHPGADNWRAYFGRKKKA